ncbi:hypothetical protein IPV08_21765 [Methylobacterium sp. SD274]|uniref:hypothetical protein n=1 Tax=Methylobacterium sp. SD274 TaxID=2782009 RepID=UPI001A9758EF|nr:hypothetical protein [Methylobacterium sp. SD274]MBO1022594.1 hypothetical protein [Methylobacterium sp. SD274]
MDDDYGDVYSLDCEAVPVYPTNGDVVGRLRWCIAVCDSNDRGLGFAASLLSFAIERGGLTVRQLRCAETLIERIRHQWATCDLDCQQMPASSRGFDLRAVPPEGCA